MLVLENCLDFKLYCSINFSAIPFEVNFVKDLIDKKAYSGVRDTSSNSIPLGSATRDSAHVFCTYHPPLSKTTEKTVQNTESRCQFVPLFQQNLVFSLTPHLLACKQGELIRRGLSGSSPKFIFRLCPIVEHTGHVNYDLNPKE